MSSKNKWIEEVENSLEGLKPVEASPYLYPKILNRLELRREDYISARMVWLTSCSLALLLLINLATLEASRFPGKPDQKELQSLADQFQLINANIINYN
jgi:hypothetical protein